MDEEEQEDRKLQEKKRNNPKTIHREGLSAAFSDSTSALKS
jgi:hypothetical protein